MKDKSLEMLEFPKVKEILAGYTSFGISRELALDIRPLSSPEEISRLLKQSSEARHLLSLEPDLSIGGIMDIREPVTLAARGKSPELATLLDVQRSLAGMRYLRGRLERLSSEAPLLWDIGRMITPFPQIEKDISGCISPAGDLMDLASPRLGELRWLLRTNGSN